MSEMYKSTVDKNKRVFLKGFIVFPTFFGFSSKVYSKDKDFMLNNSLAGTIYFTKKKPGRWKNIAGSHVPIVKKKKDLFEVSTAHEMRGFEHYIVKHLVLDNKLNLISEVNFDPARDIPISKHNLQGYKGSIFALSVCNLHDTWLSSYKIF